MSRWIKCSERMPELDDDGYSEPVLAINEIGNMQVVSFYSDEGWDSCTEITHWQPLPPPPNSEITSIIIDEFESVEKCTA
mgnify:FL=1